jgi:tetratricopeptide (TPR) repeat protein
VELGRVDSALALYEAALEVSEELDIQPWIATILIGRGSAYRLKGEYALGLADLDRAHSISINVENRIQLIYTLLSRCRLFGEVGYWAGCDSALAELDSFAGRGLSYDQDLEMTLEKAKLLHARGRSGEALEAALHVLDGARRPETSIRARLVLGEIALDLEGGSRAERPSENAGAHPGSYDAADGTSTNMDALEELTLAVQEAHIYPFRRFEAEGLRLKARALCNRERYEGATGAAGEALKLAEHMELDPYDYLVTSGDVLAAAGREDRALALYVRALDRAATVSKRKCPHALRPSYLDRKRIRDYIALVEDLRSGDDGRTQVRDYREVFDFE